VLALTGLNLGSPLLLIQVVEGSAAAAALSAGSQQWLSPQATHRRHVDDGSLGCASVGECSREDLIISSEVAARH
jgi:hypothetical protein